VGLVLTHEDVRRRARVALILRADVRPGDGSEASLEFYWTKGKGLARWITHPHPWTRLRNLLRKYVGPKRADGLASHYFRLATGLWPGERFGENKVGPG
jgi:hypothetical protein